MIEQHALNNSYKTTQSFESTIATIAVGGVAPLPSIKEFPPMFTFRLTTNLTSPTRSIVGKRRIALDDEGTSIHKDGTCSKRIKGGYSMRKQA